MHFLTTYTIYVHRGGLEPIVAFQLSWGESIPWSITGRDRQPFNLTFILKENFELALDPTNTDCGRKLCKHRENI